MHVTCRKERVLTLSYHFSIRASPPTLSPDHFSNATHEACFLAKLRLTSSHAFAVQFSTEQKQRAERAHLSHLRNDSGIWSLLGSSAAASPQDQASKGALVPEVKTEAAPPSAEGLSAEKNPSSTDKVKSAVQICVLCVHCTCSVNCPPFTLFGRPMMMVNPFRLDAGAAFQNEEVAAAR